MENRSVRIALWLLLLPAAGAAQVPLGPEFRVNDYTSQSQGQPSVGCAGNGDCVMVWNSYGQDGHRGGVFARRYDASGAAIGVEFQVNVATPQAQHTPSVAVDTEGRFMVVWTGQDDLSASDYSYGGVFARQYDADGNAGPEFQVNTYTTGLQGAQKVAAIAPGYFVVVWNDYAQYTYGRVLGKIYDAFGTAVAEGPISPTASRAPALAADGNTGEFVVVWSRLVNGWDVFGERFYFGTPTSAVFQANTYTTGSQSVPGAAVLSTGDFVVTWQDQRFVGYVSQNSVRGQRFLSWGPPDGADFQVNAYTTIGYATRPVMAAQADGGFVVAWTSRGQDGSADGVFARRYGPSGMPGAEFRVNSYTTDYQSAPALAFNSATRFVVAWGSQAPQDGSLGGVFGQRFSTDLSLDVIFKDCFDFPPCL